jgi:F-type H+-transporting ATPase subunit a
LDFNVSNLWVFDIAGVEVWITETMLNTWIIMLLLIAFAAFVRFRLRAFKEIPTGFQNAVESIVEVFDGFVRSTVGERFMYLGNWFFMVFAFVLVSNLSGLVGIRPPTADWTTALALALATFVLIHAMGIVHRKGRYLKSFFEPNLIFFPLNVIGELARPISLSFRLFGNVLAGVILMSMVYSLIPIYLRFAIPAVLHAYFDLFSGMLQTYIFCILSLTFIRTASAAEAA